MLVLNLKTYAESTGLNCKRILDISTEYLLQNPNLKSKVIFAVASSELFWAKQNYPDLIIAAQHVDNKLAGKTSGWIPAETLVSYGIEYSIYNHSEHREYSNSTIIQDIQDIQSKGLKLFVCCENTQEGLNLAQANPFALVYEPKDLIGSGVSVTTRPEVAAEFIESVKDKTNVLIGAGVTTTDDIQKALELGAKGVLLSSAFALAKDTKAKLDELVQPFA